MCHRRQQLVESDSTPAGPPKEETLPRTLLHGVRLTVADSVHRVLYINTFGCSLVLMKDTPPFPGQRTFLQHWIIISFHKRHCLDCIGLLVFSGVSRSREGFAFIIQFSTYTVYWIKLYIFGLCTSIITVPVFSLCSCPVDMCVTVHGVNPRYVLYVSQQVHAVDKIVCRWDVASPHLVSMMRFISERGGEGEWPFTFAESQRFFFLSRCCSSLISPFRVLMHGGIGCSVLYDRLWHVSNYMVYQHDI